jgi:hypothetical protein
VPPSGNRSTSPFEKPLPHNSEAERAILGAVLLDNTALERALHSCAAGDFFLPQHKWIIRAMCELAKAAQPIDSVTLMETLARENALDAAGGVPYISQLADGLPRVTNVEHYGKIVAEKAVLRRIITEAHDVMGKAFASDAEIPDLQRQLAGAAAAAVPANGNGNSKLDFGLLEFLKLEIPPPDHLIEGVMPRGGSGLIVAMPHHLKSWFTLALALGCTSAGTVMGKLEVKQAFRTMLVSIEDPGNVLQWRIRQLISAGAFSDCDEQLVRIWPRGQGAFDIMHEPTFQTLVRRAKEHQAELTILDVLRRIFGGDINSPKESAALCEQLDRYRDATGSAVLLVHHENRKAADIMQASAGSFNIPGWSNVVIQFKRKAQQGARSHVEIEVDNKLGASLEPVLMTLDLTAERALWMESLEDSASIEEIRHRLGQEWTIRDLAEVLDVHKSNAYRRLKKMEQAGRVEKIKGGKRGRIGGLARYQFVQDASEPEA